MIGVLSAQNEFKIDVVVKLPIHRAFEANTDALGAWTACVASDLLDPPVALHFDPAARSQSPPHRRVPNRHAKVLLAFLGHERLIKRLRLGGLRACEVVIGNIVFTAAIVAVSIVTFIYALVIIKLGQWLVRSQMLVRRLAQTVKRCCVAVQAV